MTNNLPLLNALYQINKANRNKQLSYLFGTIALIGVVGFTVYYVKFQDQTKNTIYYREKWLKAKQNIDKRQNYAAQLASLEKNSQAIKNESKEATIS